MPLPGYLPLNVEPQLGAIFKANSSGEPIDFTDSSLMRRNETGAFSAQNLEPVTYRIEVQAVGFKKKVIEEVERSRVAGRSRTSTGEDRRRCARAPSPSW